MSKQELNRVAFIMAQGMQGAINNQGSYVCEKRLDMGSVAALVGEQADIFARENSDGEIRED